MSLHILATQFLIKTTNSPNLVVYKSWYIYNLSLGRLLEGDPLECCLYLAYNCWDLPPYTLIWHYTFIRHIRVRRQMPCDYHAIYWRICQICPIETLISDRLYWLYMFYIAKSIYHNHTNLLESNATCANNWCLPVIYVTISNVAVIFSWNGSTEIFMTFWTLLKELNLFCIFSHVVHIKFVGGMSISSLHLGRNICDSYHISSWNVDLMLLYSCLQVVNNHSNIKSTFQLETHNLSWKICYKTILKVNKYIFNL